MRHFNEKDFSHLIGSTHHDLMILSITPPLADYKSQRFCECQCSCGNKVITRLERVLNGTTKSCGHLKVESGRIHHSNLNQEKAYLTRTSKDIPIKTNKTTGIRNISWSGREKKFIVSLRRHGKTFKGRADTLQEAIALKGNLVIKAESYFNEIIYKIDNDKH